jgi:putative transposase
MATRRKFSSQFKTDVVLESLRGDSSPAEICRRYNIGADQLSRWRKQVLEGIPQLFEEKNPCQEHSEKIRQLEQLAGRLTLELEISKKAFNSFSLRHSSKGSL